MVLTDLLPFPTDDMYGPAADPWTLIRLHFTWIVPNVLFAVVPWLFAVLLFRRGLKPNVLWLAGLVPFVLWLPYAPYLLTDVIHLPEAVGRSPVPLLALGIFVPTFSVYLAAGFLLYVDALRRMRRYVIELSGGRVRAWWVDLPVHGLVVVGILIGRVPRFHVWHLTEEPLQVIRESAESLWSPASVLFFAVATAALFVAARTDRPMLPATVAQLRSRVTRPRRSPTPRRVPRDP